MSRLAARQLVLGIVLVLGIPLDANAQQLRELTITLEHRTSGDDPGSPSPLVVTASAIGWSGLLALGGGSAGFSIDQAICQHRHGDEEGSLFGPCFGYAAGPTAIGWFGGAVVGAAIGAARAAQDRGCPRRSAGWRALGGAVLGVLPGVVTVARRPSKFPPARSALIFGAPLLAGGGAAAAVMTCHAHR